MFVKSLLSKKKIERLQSLFLLKLFIYSFLIYILRIHFQISFCSKISSMFNLNTEKKIHEITLYKLNRKSALTTTTTTTENDYNKNN